jgi:thiol-disulfide isomerase/thioredoxin
MVKFAIVALLVAAATAQTALGGVELLDFSSPHCGPCQSMVPVIARLEAANYPIRKIDTTREPGVAQQYHVTQIPCFIMLVDGREVERNVGAMGQDQIVAMFQRAVAARGQSPDRPAAPAQAGVQPQVQPNGDDWNNGQTAGDTARPMTHTTPLGPREPLRDAFSNELIGSSVRLRVDDANGHSFGTGTIIDARSGEALVITCGHLFRDSKGQGPVSVELFTATPDGARVVSQVQGQIVGYNLDRDIGLVSIRPNGNVRVAPIASTNTIIERGERLTSVGCDRGENPTALATRVTNLDRYQGPPNIEASGAPVEGRSGGGLFNSAGELVGVCFAADYEGNEGLYTALESIHDELDRLNLSEIYRKSGAASAETASHNPAANMPQTTATPPIVRGQEPQPLMPVAESEGMLPVTPVAARSDQNLAGEPASLNPVEQAAFEEIMNRAADSEVVCIIRPRDPSGKSEVITLPQVSPAFIRALQEQANRPSGTITR